VGLLRTLGSSQGCGFDPRVRLFVLFFFAWAALRPPSPPPQPLAPLFVHYNIPSRPCVPLWSLYGKDSSTDIWLVVRPLKSHKITWPRFGVAAIGVPPTRQPPDQSWSHEYPTSTSIIIRWLTIHLELTHKRRISSCERHFRPFLHPTSLPTLTLSVDALAHVTQVRIVMDTDGASRDKVPDPVLFPVGTDPLRYGTLPGLLGGQ
jgi:hypothetical protein